MSPAAPHQWNNQAKCECGPLHPLLLEEPPIAELEEIVTQRITFIDERLISQKLIESTSEKLQDIDENDTVFVALADLLKAKLWTGDKQLYNGLKGKNYKTILSTAELSLLLADLESQ